MNFFYENNGFDLSRTYKKVEESLELKQMTWNSCSTVSVNLHKEDIDTDKKITLQEGVDISDIIPLIGPCRTDDSTELFGRSLVCDDDQSYSIINGSNSKIDFIPDISTIYGKRSLPVIDISPPIPEDRNIVYFQSHTEDKSYLTVPPKPTKGDYYGKNFWMKCDKIVVTDSIPPLISKELVTPNENVIQLMQEEELKVCNINRTHYTRGTNSPFTKLYSKFYYKHNKEYDKNLPYRAEFIRYSHDQRGEINLYSKCGLCPFCPKIVFKNMTSFEYYDHLSLCHGITRNNQLIPDPGYFGIYKFMKDNIVYYHQGVTCTICGDALKISNSKSLHNYMKHYRDEHS